jgi:hypothetical protein
MDPSRQHRSVSSTDTSTCYHHLVSWIGTSACYLHLVTLTLSSTCTSQLKQGPAGMAKENGAISHPLLNEGACIRAYSAVRPSYSGHSNDLQEMCRIGLIVEYSRMQVPSLSSGCEIAPFSFATSLAVMSQLCFFTRGGKVRPSRSSDMPASSSFFYVGFPTHAQSHRGWCGLDRRKN